MITCESYAHIKFTIYVEELGERHISIGQTKPETAYFQSSKIRKNKYRFRRGGLLQKTKKSILINQFWYQMVLWVSTLIPTQLSGLASTPQRSTLQPWHQGRACIHYQSPNIVPQILIAPSFLTTCLFTLVYTLTSTYF